MDIKRYQEKLETELSTVEQELTELGRKNPSNPKDWQATAGEQESEPSDILDQGLEMEQFEERSAIVENLEVRFNELKAALERIALGTYGICEISGEPIEPERLEANPAARTCIAHREEK